jgi:hypothetical protein
VSGFSGPVQAHCSIRKCSAGLWTTPAGGGNETEVLSSVTLLNFAVAKDGIYHIPRPDKQGRYSINFFNFVSRTTMPVMAINGAAGNGVAVSPDGKALLCSARDPSSSDLMLVDNYR